MNFLLLLLLIVGFVVVAVIAFVLSVVVNVLKVLRQGSPFGFGKHSREHRGSSGWDSADGSRRTEARRKNGSTVVDTRSQDAANRKIYEAGEGEYVDYEAVKE